MTQPPDQLATGDEGEQQAQAAFPCTYCGADTREDRVKAAFWGDRGLVAIEDIPARICQGCGEQFYDDATSQKIERIVNGSAIMSKREIIVPLFSLADVNSSNARGRWVRRWSHTRLFLERLPGVPGKSASRT